MKPTDTMTADAERNITTMLKIVALGGHPARRAPQIEARRKGDKNYVYFEFLPL